MTDSRYPESTTDAEIDVAYPDFQTDHCDSCHEDLAYGFTEAQEPVVVRMPDGTLRTHWDSCCRFLAALSEGRVPHSTTFDLDGYQFQEAVR